MLDGYYILMEFYYIHPITFAIFCWLEANHRQYPQREEVMQEWCTEMGIMVVTLESVPHWFHMDII